MRLLEAYRIAYTRNVSYTAWVNGQYNNIAFSIAYGNAWAKNKSDIKEFPAWQDPIEKQEKTIVTKDNLEQEFRKRHLQTNQFINSLLTGSR